MRVFVRTELRALLDELPVEDLPGLIQLADERWFRDIMWSASVGERLAQVELSWSIDRRRLALLDAVAREYAGRRAQLERLRSHIVSEESSWAGGETGPRVGTWMPDIDVGPLVPVERIPTVLIDVLVRQAPLLGQEVAVLRAAGACLHRHRPSHCFVELSRLAPSAQQPIVARWWLIAIEVGRYGPPALAALICSVPDLRATTRAEGEAALGLLTSLRDRSYRDDIDIPPSNETH